MKRVIVSAVIFALTLASVAAGKGTQTARPFTADDLLKVRRVSDPQLSPDGRWIAYNIAETDKAANKRISQIYLISTEGGEPRQITSEKQSSTGPRWSPDGKRLAFVSAREGESQVWTVEITETGAGELKKVTSMATGADAPIWSPDGKWIAFTSEVYADCASAECNKIRTDEAAASKVKAKSAERLLYRHWTTWKDGKRSHIFVSPSDGGEARDVTPGDSDAPPFSLGGPADFAFSPDSKELAFARNTDKIEAISTNADIFVVPISGGEARRITAENPAADLSPQYSPDGRYVGYRAQSKPGFESDRWRLMLYDRKTGQSHSITEQLDSSVEGFTFAPDNEKVYLVAGERGRQPIYEIPLGGGPFRKIIGVLSVATGVMSERRSILSG